MDAPPPSLQPTAPSAAHVASTQNDDPPMAAVHSTSNGSKSSVGAPVLSRSTINGGKTIIIKKKKKKKKRPPEDGSDSPPPSSSSSSCCTMNLVQRGFRVSCTRRNPRISIGSARQKESDVETLAYPLGMSIAAVLAQVLERKDTSEKRMSFDHISKICTLAVRESLANVFGNKFDCFARNFEKSFTSTLMTLRLIDESSQSKGKYFSDVTPPIFFNGGDSTCNSGVDDCQSEAAPHISTREQLNAIDVTKENMQTNLMSQVLVSYDGHTNQQLTSVSPSTLGSVINQSIHHTLEKSVMEQARSNDLKTFEIGLVMKKLRLKETQLALNSVSNHLEKCKLSMGISKASFRADKFKNQLEETKLSGLLKTCLDCLVAGLFIMLGCLAYGAYIYSHKRITDATRSCTPTLEPKSWWIPKPMASFNSGLQILSCQVQVVSRMLFGVLMILAIAYLLMQRSATSQQTMPVTFVLLLLGVACGFAGKLCIDTLGGSGYYWLIYWEALCLLHFFSNVCTSSLFCFLHGPITVSQNSRASTIFPYWSRQFLFYTTVLLFLPLLCGFMPFAGIGEWKDHFSSLVVGFLLITDD